MALIRELIRTLVEITLLNMALRRTEEARSVSASERFSERNNH
jgi:hypothetical protein